LSPLGRRGGHAGLAFGRRTLILRRRRPHSAATAGDGAENADRPGRSGARFRRADDRAPRHSAGPSPPRCRLRRRSRADGPAARSRDHPGRAGSRRPVIAPRRALLAAALCWIGFAVIVALVETGHGARLDAAGLTVWRQSGHPGLPRGPAWLLEAARDFTALGGPLLRNLFALAAVAALLFLRERRR